MLGDADQAVFLPVEQEASLRIDSAFPHTEANRYFIFSIQYRFRFIEIRIFLPVPQMRLNDLECRMGMTVFDL